MADDTIPVPSAALFVNDASFPYGSSAEANPPKHQGEYTLEDYYALPEDMRAELIDGVLFEMNSPRVSHQAVIGLFHAQLLQKIRENGGTCLPFLSPLDVQLDCDNRTMVQPDVLLICHPERIRDFGIYGAPDFILEVLSPSTRKKDLLLKSAKYAKAGVQEYWIIDPETRTLLLYDFQKENNPLLLPLSGTVGLRLLHEQIQIDLEEIREMLDILQR